MSMKSFVSNSSANLRKAAVFVRSLDSDTAATMLGQLSADEAAAIREAIRRLGPLDVDEQADVLAELQRRRPTNGTTKMGGVELELSASVSNPDLGDSVRNATPAASSKRFEFLEDAPVSALVTFLAREHAQTIAVVLSHLEPARAADVLAALPQSLQVEAIERLAALGQSDPESVTVLEKELADWVAKRSANRQQAAQRSNKVAEILAAADGASRESLLTNLRSRNALLASRVAPSHDRQPPTRSCIQREPQPNHESTWNTTSHGVKNEITDAASNRSPSPPSRVPAPSPVPPIDFDHLIHLDTRTLAMVLRDVDANVLALALAGSSDDLVDRICDQMPKRIARTFRRELRRLGPTRLSDVETAQRAVARAATRHLAARRRSQLATRA
jgi:flagellar motor switch protein FliG